MQKESMACRSRQCTRNSIDVHLRRRRRRRYDSSQQFDFSGAVDAVGDVRANFRVPAGIQLTVHEIRQHVAHFCVHALTH
jgi:NADPH:quinone reductase-like Zn-dependent oxidoreductase